MTGITGITAVNMTRGFTGSHGAIMTTETSTVYLGMIHCGRSHRRPIGGEFLVAQLALIAAVYMGGPFARGGHTIVAADTVIYDISMIHRRRHPLLYAVAEIALLGGGYMLRMLARGNGAVVTGGTDSDDLRVIDRGR